MQVMMSDALHEYASDGDAPYMPVSARRKIPTLSLFAGAGGLDIGFHNAGFDILAAVEIEEAYCKTLRANSGQHKVFGSQLQVFCEDVRRFDPSPYKDLGIECVIGGPPCQTFSAAGRRSGGVLGTTDERGKLFQAYCQILRELAPKIFVFENVYGLPGANGGQPWREILHAFSELGYTLRAEVLDSADYGVPQHRERLIMVGYKSGNYEFPLPTHGPDAPNSPPFVTALQAIIDLQDPDEPYHQTLGGLYGHLLPLVPEGLNYAFFTKEMGYPEPVFAWRSKFHDLLYKVDRNAPVRTIKAQPGKFTGPFHWKNRHFTVAELKRLQSFPDEYEMVGTFNKVVEQIGNSVPPKLAEVIAISVREQLLDQSPTLTFPVRWAGFRSTFRQRQRERTLHFKQVAAREIQRRFAAPKGTAERRQVTEERYFFIKRGLFHKEVLQRLPGDLGTANVFAVSSRVEGKRAEISFHRHDSSLPSKLQVSVNITGLEKYIGDLDVLNVVASLDDAEDIFSLWSAIEDVLVSASKFYTLIDIYGHYANRGDTVKVVTNIVAQESTPLLRSIEFFGRSEHCGQFLHKEAMARQIGVASAALERVIADMRSVRFDVRTRSTHPTVPKHHVLCTYPFPLLGEKVHLQRRVRVIDDADEEIVVQGSLF
jgi:DNA (cytosine-5)-methyltransferase 1